MDRKFEKVTRLKDVDLKLPQRSTKHSAGYDFYAYEDIVIPPHSFHSESIKPYCIKTGIKVKMCDDECLKLYPRSSWPSKLGLVMANSVGIIDSDYYENEDNEGEIGFLVYNLTSNDVIIRAGDKLGQGIFVKFLLTDDDTSDGTRVGGYGSTGA